MKKTELSEPLLYPEKATTNFRDLEGSISVDFPGDHNRTEFKNYTEKIGLDMEKYHPIGIHIHDSENTGINDMNVSIIAIDKQLEKEYRDKNNDTIPLIEFKHIDTFDNLRKYLYRIDIRLTEKYYDNSKMEIIAQIRDK